MIFGSVVNCCEFSTVNFANMTDPELVKHYKVTMPSGPNSYLKKDGFEVFPENSPVLFPFVIFIGGLTCEDLNITINGFN